MQYETILNISDMLKKEIAIALDATWNTLEISSLEWAGESKCAYDSIKETTRREIDRLKSALGGL